MTETTGYPNGRPEGVPIVEFDLASYNGVETSNAAWDDLRKKCPIAWSDDNAGAWLISSHELVTAAFRNWESFRSSRNVRDFDGQGGSPEWVPVSSIPIPIKDLVIPEELDPPMWDPYRRAFAELLSPRATEALKPRIKYWTTKRLDDVIETGQMDIVHTLSNGVSAAVILEWLGFPEEVWERLSDAFHNRASLAAGSEEERRYLEDLAWSFERIEEKTVSVRECPTKDAASFFANVEVGGERTSFEYAKGMINLAVAGGVDTTTSVASAAWLHLHRHPEDRQRLLDEPELIDRAVEEFLRMYPPARTHGRTVVQDTELGGLTLRKDDRIILSEVSANRDEAAFADADKFIIDRFPNRHVSFGIGIHRCPGSHLARAMFKEMLTQVLERIPDYRVDEDGTAEFPNCSMISSWARMPITFTPGERRLPQQ